MRCPGELVQLVRAAGSPDRESFEVAAVRPTPENKPQAEGCNEENKGWRFGHGRHIGSPGVYSRKLFIGLGA